MLCLCETAKIGYHREAFIRAFRAQKAWEEDRKLIDSEPGNPALKQGEGESQALESGLERG